MLTGVWLCACETGGTNQPEESGDRLEQLFLTAVERMLPSTVRISPDSVNPLSRVLSRAEDGRESEGRSAEQPEEEWQVGSGVVMTSDGFILTNAHVVSSMSRLLVTLYDGREFSGQVVGIDEASDLAVVKVEGLSGLPVPEMSTGRVKVGQWALALGAPYGLDNSLSVGVVSSVERRGLILGQIVDYIQVTTPLHPGNSGGPLFDTRGRLLGINTMVRGLNTGLGFAIPTEQAWQIGRRLIAHGEIRRPWLGVRVLDAVENRDLLSPFFPLESRGALIEVIEPHGPAAGSELRPFDLIVELEGRRVNNPAELISEIGRREVGEEVSVTVLRAQPTGKPRRLSFKVRLDSPDAGEQLDLSADKAQGDEQPAWDALGLVVEERPKTESTGADSELVVKKVDSASQAAALGLIAGSVIRAVNLVPLSRIEQYREALTQARKKFGRALVLFSFEGVEQFAVLELVEQP